MIDRVEQWRILVPGRDVSRWADMKVARAVEGLVGLKARLASWDAAVGAHLRPTLGVDRSTIDMHLVVAAAPPVDVWAMELGESIHHLRSALDAIAWDVAQLDGGKPANPTQLYFPVAKTGREWDKLAQGALSSIPLDILARLHALQSTPFLSVLHALDIQDKHRGLIGGKVRLHRADLNLQFEHGGAPFEEHAPIHIGLLDDPIDITDGTYAGLIRFGKPLPPNSVRDTLSPVGVALFVEHDGREIELSTIIDTFPQQTTEVLRHVYG